MLALGRQRSGKSDTDSKIDIQRKRELGKSRKSNK